MLPGRNAGRHRFLTLLSRGARSRCVSIGDAENVFPISPYPRSMKAPIESVVSIVRFFCYPSRRVHHPIKRTAPLLRLAVIVLVACAGLRQVAFAGAASTQLNTLAFNISDSNGQLVSSQDLSGIVSYDPSTGELGTVPVGTPLSGNWNWSTVDFTDPTHPLATPVLTWHTDSQTNGVWDSVVQLKALGNVDPFMSYSFSAKNNTTVNQNFTFSYGESIVPPVTGSYSIYSDIAGSLTHGAVTPFAQLTPTLGDFDGDGISEIQTLKLSTDGGLTFLNAGVDLGGIQQSGNAGGTTIFGPIAGTVTGNLASIDYWQFDVAFTLTPGKDAAALSGYAAISAIPEPATCAGLMGGLVLLGATFRRRLGIAA